MANYSDSPTVDVALDKERVKQMGAEEKLNILVDIAFVNHKLLQNQGGVLFGKDGNEGICDTVRTTRRALLWLWGVFCGVSGTFFLLLISHIVGKGIG